MTQLETFSVWWLNVVCREGKEQHKNDDQFWSQDDRNMMEMQGTCKAWFKLALYQWEMYGDNDMY